MTIWFTSDTHFDHKNIIKYCKRPFNSVEEMNETIIQNWNSVVAKEGDTVYHLGDVWFGKGWKYLDRLNGRINIIPGGHDKLSESDLDRKGLMARKFIFNKIYEITVDIGRLKQTIVMCHYAMRTWNKSHYGSWHLYGHSHGNLPPHGLSFDVGVDTNNFYPYSLDDVIKKMNTLSREFVIKENQ